MGCVGGLYHSAPIHAAGGRLDEARAAYREAQERDARAYLQPSLLAVAAAAVGEVDRAVSYAERALRDRDPLLVLMARTWPTLDGLRADPRFVEIVRQLGLPDWRPPSWANGATKL